MSGHRARAIAVVLALLSALGAGAALADEAWTARIESVHPAAVHEGAAAKPASAAPRQKVYFRPFCRRSRYVTNTTAPCYD